MAAVPDMVVWSARFQVCVYLSDHIAWFNKMARWAMDNGFVVLHLGVKHGRFILEIVNDEVAVRVESGVPRGVVEAAVDDEHRAVLGVEYRGGLVVEVRGSRDAVEDALRRVQRYLVENAEFIMCDEA